MDSALREMIAVAGGLAGVGCREDFGLALSRQWGTHERSGQPLSLVMVEIDYFCQYQWACGICASDDCLDSIATAILESVRRPAAQIFAWGPGRFAALLPETSRLEADRIAEEICFQSAALVIPHPCSPLARSVTVTAGLATARPSTGISPVSLARDAEQVLTQSRAARRPCVSGSGRRALALVY
jgi:diguanylate cyclase (GGDEF)-like protein